MTERDRVKADGMGSGKKAVLWQGFDHTVTVMRNAWFLIMLFLMSSTAVIVSNDSAQPFAFNTHDSKRGVCKLLEVATSFCLTES